jgi:hypothetical protein
VLDGMNYSANSFWPHPSSVDGKLYDNRGQCWPGDVKCENIGFPGSRMPSMQYSERPLSHLMRASETLQRSVNKPQIGRTMDDVEPYFLPDGQSSRFIIVWGLPRTLQGIAVRDIFEAYGDIIGIFIGKLHVEGFIIVGYPDLRDAIRVKTELRYQRFFDDRLLRSEFLTTDIFYYVC